MVKRDEIPNTNKQFIQFEKNKHTYKQNEVMFYHTILSNIGLFSVMLCISTTYSAVWDGGGPSESEVEGVCSKHGYGATTRVQHDVLFIYKFIYFSYPLEW